MNENWHRMIAEAEFPAEGKLTAVLNGWHILIVSADDGFHAVNDRCTHAASPLNGGRIRRGVVMCPLHGARFELGTGKCLGGNYRDLRVFPVRIVDGTIEVALPETKPAIDELPIAM